LCGDSVCCSAGYLVAVADKDGGVDALLLETDEVGDVDVDDVVCGARVNQDVDASPGHYSRQVHCGATLDGGVVGPDHHEQVVVDVVVVVVVIVVDSRDVKEMFALVASSEGFITVEAESRSAMFRHLFGSEALEQEWWSSRR
jgi:hypothetical protein